MHMAAALASAAGEAAVASSGVGDLKRSPGGGQLLPIPCGRGHCVLPHGGAARNAIEPKPCRPSATTRTPMAPLDSNAASLLESVTSVRRSAAMFQHPRLKPLPRRALHLTDFIAQPVGRSTVIQAAGLAGTISEQRREDALIAPTQQLRTATFQQQSGPNLGGIPVVPKPCQNIQQGLQIERRSMCKLSWFTNRTAFDLKIRI